MYNFGPEANCNGLDTELFFTDASKTYPNMPTLKRICNNCVVKDACLDYALHHGVLGWWGGTSEKTRRAMQQKLNISPEPVLITEKWVA
jgi:WhiB family redox-sensing transcriptional regulator